MLQCLPSRAAWLAVLTLLPLATPIPAQAGGDSPQERAAQRLADLQAFRAWFADWEKGAIRLVKDLREDAAAVATMRSTIEAVAAWDDLECAKTLFAAAAADPSPPGERTATDRIDFRAELRPWAVRAAAQEAIAGMDGAGIEDWLLASLRPRALRAIDRSGDEARQQVEAVLQILGRREGIAARLALLEAAGSMPDQLRIRALSVLADHAGIGLVDTFVGMMRDKEAKVRIVACDATATALAPLTDETKGRPIPEDVAEKRDEAIEAMQRLLERDKVWQVRAAACNNLARLKSKHVVPALIEGLEAELRRKRDPWAMDLLLGRTLVKLTGQNIPATSAEPWKAFWKDNGDSFVYVSDAAEARRRNDAGEGRYSKFFNLNLESDRLLFIIDFSGSMEEPITLETGTTSARAGTRTTKAKLVVDEMKKIVLSLPNGSVFNVIVFSDNVRIWRPAGDEQPALVRLDDAAKDDLLGTFLDSLVPSGPTNLYGALEAGLRAAGGRALRDKYYAAGFDTIYVLSDGAPSWGEVTDKDEIRARVRQLNRLRRLTIHSITFGNQNDTDFLRLLAEENGGRHVHVQ